MKIIIRFFIAVVVLFTATTDAFAAKIPDNVKNFVKKEMPGATFRFDGLLSYPDGTLYLPLYPALIKKFDTLSVKATMPSGQKPSSKPNVIILNNDFVLLKVLTDSKGRKTILYIKEPPIEIKTGLLPQDILVPTGLIIPDNVKGIIGNLQIPTANDAGLKVKAEPSVKRVQKATSLSKNQVQTINQLKDKTIYIATCYSKNIQVVKGESSTPEYALAQKGLIYDMKATPDEKFLLVTTFGKTFVNVISLADERIIKQIDLTTPAEEIVIDKARNLAYITSGSNSLIYVMDLNSMKLKQKIKIKGMCQKLALGEGNILFYTDKKTNDLWTVDIPTDYTTKNIGSFPSITKICYSQGKIYVISRIKNRLAIIDLATTSLISEIPLDSKPVDMLAYKDKLFILSAGETAVQVLNTKTDELVKTINLNTGGFSTKIYQIKNTNLAIVTDTKTNKYCVIDLDKNTLIKTNTLEIPVSFIEVLKTIKKTNSK
ncbi:MAG: hypothetical protein MJ229_05405 [bacterium]|nr:hypothetical protein [bacterium]